MAPVSLLEASDRESSPVSRKPKSYPRAKRGLTRPQNRPPYPVRVKVNGRVNGSGDTSQDGLRQPQTAAPVGQ